MDPDPDRNFECFTFLKFENPSSGSKVKGHQSLVLLDPDLSDLVMDLLFKLKTLNTQEYKLYVTTVLTQIQTLM